MRSGRNDKDAGKWVGGLVVSRSEKPGLQLEMHNFWCYWPKKAEKIFRFVPSTSFRASSEPVRPHWGQALSKDRIP